MSNGSGTGLNRLIYFYMVYSSTTRAIRKILLLMYKSSIEQCSLKRHPKSRSFQKFLVH